MVAAIHEVFDPLGQGDKAVRVAQCESGLDPGAVSPGGAYHGLFQLGAHFDATVAFYGGTRLDAWANIQAARDAYLARGWQPWPHCGRL